MAGNLRKTLQVEVGALIAYAAAVALPVVALLWGRGIGVLDLAATVERGGARELHERGAPGKPVRFAVELNDSDRDYLMGLVMDTLRGMESSTADATPAGVRGAGAPSFVTLYAPGGALVRAMADGQSLADGVRAAARRALEKAKERAWEDQRLQDVRVRTDIVTELVPFSNRQRRAFAVEGLDAPFGLALGPGQDLAGCFLPADAAVRGTETHLEMLARLCTDSGLEADAWSDGGLALYRIRAESFVNAYSGRDRALSTPRGIPLVERVTLAKLLRACNLAGDFLVRSQRNDGSFAAIYRADENEWAGVSGVLEEAGAVYALCRLFALWRNGAHLLAARASLPRLREQVLAEIDRAGTGSASSSVGLRPEGQVEVCAAVLCALCEYRGVSDDRNFDELMEELGNFLLRAQRPDGGFAETLQAVPGQQPDRAALQTTSGRSQGMAVLALVLAFGQLQEEQFLDGARRCLDYIAGLGDESLADYGPWTMLALERAVPVLGQERYRQLAWRIVDSALGMQITEDHGAEPDLVGASLSSWPPTVLGAARDLQRFVSGWHLADPEQPVRKKDLLACATRAARLLLSLQFVDENSYYIPDLEQASGGFRFRPGSNTVLLGSVQHSAAALAGLADILRTEREGER